MTPDRGFTDETTEITASGTGFQEGATLTVADDVVVTNLDGQSSQPLAAFTYVLPPPPVLTSLSPSSGSSSGGTEVQIIGTNFQVGLTVTFDGFGMPARLDGSTALFVTTRPHAAGKIQIVVINPSGVASNALTYTFASQDSLRDPLGLR